MRSTKNRNRVLIMERDYKILRFLWKWKAISTHAIAKKFFPNIKVDSAFRRLTLLESANYIETFETDAARNRVWTLTDKGMKHISPRLGDLESKGFKSENPFHDFISSAFHLGEWLTKQPANTQTYSEQQLRRFHPDTWPVWVPKSTIHRPDGYSILMERKQPVVVAFETELFSKALQRYESTAAFYDSLTTVRFVLWLVGSRIVLNSVLTAFDKCQIRDRSKHNFVVLSDFSKHGWQAPIIHGSLVGKSPLQLLNPNSIHEASKSHPGLDALALLDSRRRPGNSDLSIKTQNSKILD